MSNQDILDKLSEIESALYYRADGSDNTENISITDCQTARDLVNNALIFWHNATGLTIS